MLLNIVNVVFSWFPIFHYCIIPTFNHCLSLFLYNSFYFHSIPDTHDLIAICHCEERSDEAISSTYTHFSFSPPHPSPLPQRGEGKFALNIIYILTENWKQKTGNLILNPPPFFFEDKIKSFIIFYLISSLLSKRLTFFSHLLPLEAKINSSYLIPLE